MAVIDVLALDEFVDLYKILEVPATSTDADLRERVNSLYLEAQRNLDHHNFRKRFYYQQLYEVHLPQAHQLLLNAPQRADYDRYLNCFNKGLPFPTDSGPGEQAPSSTDLSRSERLDEEMLPAASAETMQAAKAAQPAKSEAAPKPGPKASFDFDQAKERMARPAAPKTAPKPSSKEWQKKQAALDTAEMERRRDSKRRDLIKGELIAAGTTYGVGAGIACAVVLAAPLLLALSSMKMLGNAPVLIIGLIVIAGIAWAAGDYSVKNARRRIVVELSKMPYDQLLRRCSK